MICATGFQFRHFHTELFRFPFSLYYQVVCLYGAILFFNHKNYNFLDCDWFKKLIFFTNLLAKLLTDSLLSDSSISQSLLKL